MVRYCVYLLSLLRKFISWFVASGYARLDVSFCCRDYLVGELVTRLARSGASLLLDLSGVPCDARDRVVSNLSLYDGSSLLVAASSVSVGLLSRMPPCSVAVVVSSSRDLLTLFSAIERCKYVVPVERVMAVIDCCEDVLAGESVADYVADQAEELGITVVLPPQARSVIAGWGYKFTGNETVITCMVLQEYCKEGKRFYVLSEFDPPPIVLEVENLQLYVPLGVGEAAIAMLASARSCDEVIGALERLALRGAGGRSSCKVSLEPCITIRRGNVKVHLDDEFMKVLALVDRYGSLRRVSAELGVPLTTLKKRIAKVERTLGLELIETLGRGRSGGTRLTEFSRRILELYNEVRRCFKDKAKAVGVE